MTLEDGELKVIFDGVWNGCIGSVTLFNCLFNAIKLQPGVDAEKLANDLRGQLQSFLSTLEDPSLAHQTVGLANSLLQDDDV